MELVNFVQAFLINVDAQMYDPESNTPALARTSNLNQDLGQIEYVFSDKTGTLTRNVMEFKQCAIAGRVYGDFVAGDGEEVVEAASEQDGESSVDPASKSSANCFARLCSCRRSPVSTAPPQAAAVVAAASAPAVASAAVSGSKIETGTASSSMGINPIPKYNYAPNIVGMPPPLSIDTHVSNSPRVPASPHVHAAAKPYRPSRPLTASGAHDHRAHHHEARSATHSGFDTANMAPPAWTATPSAVGSGTSSGFSDPALIAALRLAEGPRVPGWGQDWRPAAAPSTAGAQSAGTGLANAAAAAVPSTPLSLADVVASETFFTCMAVCHTVVPEYEDDSGGAAGTAPATYQAESPDEGALAKAARDVGFEFRARHADHILVRRHGGGAAPGYTDYRFDILGVHEFNSTRKRMSVIARCPDGIVRLMCKGADNVIFDRAVLEPGRSTLDADLTRFASAGLRTLVLSQKVLSADDVAEWKRSFTAASVALTGRDEALAAVAERFETQLHVLGATAIEDRLQAGVPGTIRDLARAGIKTWVLTGDKVETAINIGYAARLLDSSMDIITISSEDEAVLDKQLVKLENTFSPMLTNPTSFISRLFCRRRVHGFRGSFRGRDVHMAESAEGIELPVVTASGSPPALVHSGKAPPVMVQSNTALVVTGPALVHIMHNPERERALLTVARCCSSVIACRVSPQQKAAIVYMVRSNVVPRPMTLAIGDGANDVGMIQRAEVGVGISGKEGLQAVNASDFAIAQFRFLRRLLLVHGRWSYRRMSKVVLYSFYKNVVITFTLFFFNALTGFSGTSFYESLVYSSYNFVLGLPIIVIGFVDRDISDATALAHPVVYTQGRLHLDLNPSRLLAWLTRAIAHATLIFWLAYGVYSGDGDGDGSLWGSQKGLTDGMAMAGITTFSALTFAMQVKVGVETFSWTWLNILLIAASQVGFIIFILAYQNSYNVSAEFYGVAVQALARPNYWLTIILVTGAMFVVEVTSQAARLQVAPVAVDIARELDAGFGELAENGKPMPWGDEDVGSSSSPKAVANSKEAATQGQRQRAAEADAAAAAALATSPAALAPHLRGRPSRHISSASSVREGIAEPAEATAAGAKTEAGTARGLWPASTSQSSLRTNGGNVNSGANIEAYVGSTADAPMPAIMSWGSDKMSEARAHAAAVAAQAAGTSGASIGRRGAAHSHHAIPVTAVEVPGEELYGRATPAERGVLGLESGEEAARSGAHAYSAMAKPRGEEGR